MKKLLAPSFLVLVACLILACGSGSGRQLQSITINSVVNGEQIQFTATGTFSAPPTTVTPLPVFWSYAPPPGEYALTPQPFLFSCAEPQSPGPIVAMAPANPNAPTTGSVFDTKMVFNSGPIPCPQ
jgi:hypothetical protein